MKNSNKNEKIVTYAVIFTWGVVEFIIMLCSDKPKGFHFLGMFFIGMIFFIIECIRKSYLKWCEFAFAVMYLILMFVSIAIGKA